LYQPIRLQRVRKLAPNSEMDEPAINELIRDDRPNQQTPSFRTLGHAPDDEFAFVAHLRLEP